MLSGFTIVRNAIKLDFPIVPAIRSILEVCDEVVVNVGRSEDDTRDLVASIGDPRIRIVDSEWDFAKRNVMLSIETQRAMDACRGTWGLYIQADEVLHEEGARVLRERTREWDADGRVEGLRVRVTDAVMFHYGWARPARAIREKLEASKVIYPWSRERSAREQARGHLEWIPLLRPFAGAHPRAAREWIAERAHDPERIIGPRRFKPAHLRFYVSDWIERVTGARLFEFRNYV